MKKFFKQIFATFLAITLFCSFCTALFLALIFSLSPLPNRVSAPPPNSVLYIRLNGEIVSATSNPLPQSDTIDASEIVYALSKAKDDPKIKGVFLEIGGFGGSRAAISSLAEALKECRENGKPIVTHTEYLTISSLVLSGASDYLMLHPAGLAFLQGPYISRLFFKHLLDSLGIEVTIFRSGADKNHGQELVSTGISKEEQEHLTNLLHQIHREFILATSGGAASFKYLAKIQRDNPLMPASKAEKLGLVDQLGHREDAEEALRFFISDEEESDEAEPTYISIHRYIAYHRQQDAKKAEGVPKIVVIPLSGSIGPGRNRPDYMGAGETAYIIRQYAEDPDCAGIVLLVNSGGGGAMASENIRRAVAEARTYKPVCAYVDGICASGAYLFSCEADKIIAYPASIVGSIGVVFTTFNRTKLLKKSGIDVETVKVGPHDDMFDGMRPLSESEKAMMQDMINDCHNRFVAAVADGRGMSKDKVCELATGRVWIAKEAQQFGLIDETGSLDDAIRGVAEAQCLQEEYAVVYHKDPIKPKEALRFFVRQFLQKNAVIAKQENSLQRKLQAYWPYQIVMSNP